MTTHSTPRRELTLRTPEDLLAAVPLLLGFVPERSVVMLSLSTPRGPHARADLVPPEEASALAASLAAAALGNSVDRVALVVLDEDLDDAEPVAHELLTGFEDAGIAVAALLLADGSHWRSVEPHVTTRTPQAYDALHHPFALRELIDGRVVHRSREAVRAQLDPDAALGAQVRAAASGLPPAREDGPEWVEECLVALVAGRQMPTVVEVARLLRAIDDPDNRDAAWSWVLHVDARDHLDLWLHIVRCCGPEQRAPAASLAAFFAWLVGDGALAWCAVERAEEFGGTSLSRLVADLLERAAPPMLWRPLHVRAEDRSEGVA